MGSSAPPKVIAISWQLLRGHLPTWRNLTTRDIFDLIHQTFEWMVYGTAGVENSLQSFCLQCPFGTKSLVV